jgi:CelD/BcsL family acetyltransferase involved in cellulose biosynthesis
MALAVTERLAAPLDIAGPPAAALADVASPSLVPDDIQLAVYDDLAAIERDWRAFEQHADCTVFQTFDWLATWQRHIGAGNGTTPAITVGRDLAGNILFILPLSIRPVRFARELAWLGTELCDYNAPLLAADFSARFDRAGFMALWARVTRGLQDHPRLQFDYINLTKMPEMIATQPNPMLNLPVTMNPNGAYLTHLAGDWEAFYTAKRSSTTRRRDRTKRKRLSEFGEVKFVNAEGESAILNALDVLMTQKAKLFAHMGVANLFAKPGHVGFYREMAAGAATRHLVHMSTLNVGSTAAAVNLGLTHRDCYYHLLASYDDGDVSRFGPGAAHLHDLLHLAIDRGFRIFDFTIGDERYKRDWCDTELKLFDHISSVTARGAAMATAIVAGQRLKRSIKQAPALWNAFSKGRAFIGSLSRHFRR